MTQRLKKVELFAFQSDGKWIVHHVPGVFTLAIDNLHKAVLDVCDNRTPEEMVSALKGRYGRADIEEAIRYLLRWKLLVNEEPRTQPYVPVERGYFNLVTLHVCHDCNLRCRYCYADGGSYRGERCRMSKEVAKATIDLLTDDAWELREFSINFFGGEPLLNLDLIKWTVAYGRKRAAETGKKVEFGLTTNGTLLTNEVIRYLNENEIGVEVSMDGDRESHNRMRCFPDGRGSFDVILPKVKKLLMTRKEGVSARVIFTHYNLSNIQEIKDYLVNTIGFKQVVPRLVACDRQEDFAIRENDFQRILQERRRELKKDMFNPSEHTFAQKRRRHYGCGGAINFVAVAPSGGIYFCHRLVGHKQYRMGDVFSGFDWAAQRRVLDNHVDTRWECRKCWARYLCGGRCEYEMRIFDPISCDVAREIMKMQVAASVNAL